MQKTIFSFDAETRGLWGNAWSVAAIVYDAFGNVLRTFAMRVPYTQELKAFAETQVFKNAEGIVTFDMPKVMQICESIPVAESYEDMLKKFADFYLANKQGADCVCHMGYIVESHLLREMHRLGFIGDWDAPYPLYDVSGNLQAAGEDPASVDGYAAKRKLAVTNYGTTHHPLYDCEVAAKVYLHLLSK